MRVDYATVSPGALEAMRALESYVARSGLERRLLHLIKLRASQINGCAFCVDMHAREARADGESEERLGLVAVWQDAPVFTERERAALEWTEAVTRVAETRVPDEVFERVRRYFTEAELVALTMAVVAINGWNRLNVSFRVPPRGLGSGRSGA
ncbi:carboxymuconolactone decarboxylase family protein [Thermaerobacter litoralis]